jgi:diaminopimelate epimerase
VSVAGGRVTHVTVSMGRPRLTAPEIPARVPGCDAAILKQEIDLDGRRFRFTAVSMGNPHAVVFVDGDEPLRPLAERYGPALERHPWFPKRTNAEFARVHSPTRIELVVWERGCGITLACGTGACATAVAGALESRTHSRAEVEVALLGGTLGITVGPGLETVSMRGPAEEVFRGEVDLAALLERHAARAEGAR